jgi:cytosine/adenosine deaminase-related metal-dependent hydrolase
VDAALAAMILAGARLAMAASRAPRADVEIRGRKIARIGTLPTPARAAVDLTGCMVLPGLINAHDHLAFNLFPLLGNPPYSNATEWARDVYHPDVSPVREHRMVPRDVRLGWGGLKNLISGVTTVAHHDPDSRALLRNVSVKIAPAGWAHSLAFTPDIASRYRRTPKKRPFVMHLAEGTDAESAAEILEADRLGVLNVIVHAVALDASGWSLLKKRHAAVIACPVSNLFTLGRTLPRSAFSRGVPIALGTDSALTAPGDLLDVVRAARSVWKLSASRLYRMVTTDAAKILKLENGEGVIREGGVADLTVVRDIGLPPAETLLDLRRVEMVIVSGKVKLVSERFARFAGPGFQRISVEGRGRVWVDADVARLYEEATTRLGESFRLAGRWVRIKWNK